MARKSRKNIVETAPSEPVSAVYSAAAYLRLSSDDSKKRGDSIETQRNIIENYIAAQSDMRLYRTYTDTGLTGTNFDRPGFKQMLADAESGIINCIIVKDLSRFGRNSLDTGYYLERYLPSLNVRFIAVTDDFDSNESDGGIMMPLKNVINEAYALDISRKCRSVQLQNMQEGRFVGRLAPYGYKKAPEDCHRLIPDDETETVVRQIFTWAADGIGAGEIARRLSAMGVTSPSHRNHAKGFNKSEKLLGLEYWKSRTVKDILSDRVYVGDMVQGKTRKENNKQIDIDPSKWIVVENTHEPLIDRDMFDRVQEIKAKNYERAKSIQKSATYTPNMFKGKVFCAHCGHPMHRNKQANHDYYWYRCDSQWKYGKNTCVQVSVKEEDVAEKLLTVIKAHADVILGGYAALCRQAVPVMNGIDEAELRAVLQEIDKSKRLLKSLYESLVTNVITADEFKTMKSDYEAKISVLTEKADNIRNRKREIEKQLDEHHNLTKSVLSVKCKLDLTAELVDLLVDKILIRHDKSIEIFLRYRDEFAQKELSVGA